MLSRSLNLSRRLTVALLLLALLGGVFAASASAAGVYAEPNQKLALRTGPNTRYAELFTLPQSTQITALAYARGNDVTWVQVEFSYQGEVYRGYTGRKRMSVRGEIPWERNLNMPALVDGYHNVYAAPYDDAAVLGWVEGGELVTHLGSERGYDYIEYYDDEMDELSRGYILGDDLGYTDGDGAYMVENAFVFAEPDGDSRHTGAIVQGLVVSWLGDYGDYVHILYYDSAFSKLYDGYVERRRVEKN